jgi:hypothetical protein
MNKKRGQVSWVGLMMLISLLLFKGVASAAMLCCGPDHSAHSEHPTSHQMTDAYADHSAHSTDIEQDSNFTSSTAPDEHQSSCSDCAISCTSAVMLLDGLNMPPDQHQTERIFSFTPTVYPLTGSALERPPRFYS